MSGLERESRELKPSDIAPRVLALSGGIGGAKLALGLYHLLAPGELAVLVNTGDDFEHLGLHVSPDLDTVMYTLAGLANPQTGWGRADETWQFMGALAQLGGETWFNLGDRDLATNVERTRRLAAGESLSSVTAAFCEQLGLHAQLLPMTDSPVRTLVHTPQGVLPFQHYFVRDACAPVVERLEFAGAGSSRVPEPVEALLRSGTIETIIICPSNPFISIDPILAVPGMREAISGSGATVVAISPIIGGEAVKGPTAKMMRELGLPVSTVAVAEYYGELLDGYVLDTRDADAQRELQRPSLVTNTMMHSLEDRVQLATDTLAWVRERIRNARR